MLILIIRYCILLLSLLSFGYQSYDNNQPTCTDCHTEIISGQHQHPDLESSCDLCHSSTGVDHPDSESKGFILADEVPALCYMCHEEPMENGSVHYPVEEGDCSMCHNFHSSNREGLLSDNLSENICNDCHDLNIAENDVVHQPVETGDCTKCHNPHNSSYNSLLRIDSQNICKSCHTNLINAKQSIHAPAESGECSFCHSPHSSPNNSLLNLPYPQTLYTESTVENFQLCFQCHDSEIINSELTTYATNFRDGEKNLHFVHINGPKGRNCTICHDMHASDHPYILNMSISFGKWNMNNQFTVLENGGTCSTGCHNNKSYSRN